MSDLTDIGHGMRIEVRRLTLDGVDQVAGVYFEHPCLRGEPWPGWIPVKPAAHNGWDMVSESPLTLSPSVLCRQCGFHGYIRNGKWEPC